MITIYAQASTADMAIRLANGAATGFQKYIAGIQLRDQVPDRRRVQISQLGEANGGLVNKGVNRVVAALAFVAVFVGWCVGILVASSIARDWRQAKAAEHAGLDGPQPVLRG